MRTNACALSGVAQAARKSPFTADRVNPCRKSAPDLASGAFRIRARPGQVGRHSAILQPECTYRAVALRNEPVKNSGGERCGAFAYLVERE